MPGRRLLLLGLPTLGKLSRPLAIALAALTAAALIGVPAPSPVQAQGLIEIPRITVAPTCAPLPSDDVNRGVTITVRGSSFIPNTTVALVWSGTRVAAPGDAVPVGPFGTFEATVSVLLGMSAFGYQLDAYYADALASGGGPSATTYFNTPCPNPTPTINITPDCGAPGTTVGIHIEGTGFVADLPIQARVVDLHNSQNVHAAVPPMMLDPNAVSIDLQFPIKAAGQYRVVVDQVVRGEIFDFTPFTGMDYFVAPCSTLTVVPSCGPEGGPPDRYALFLSGTGFQPLGLQIVFDPLGVHQEFYWDFAVGPDGNWGPIEINPYARGPGPYEIVVSQSNDSPVLHETRALFTVPCAPATVQLDPPCAAPQFLGDQARTFSLNVQGFGFQPGATVIVVFDPEGLSGPAFTPERAEGPAAADGSFLAPMTIAARPAGTYRVSVQQQVGAALVEGTVPPFTVPCAPSSPTLNARPNCDVEAPGQPQAYSIRLVGRRFIPGFVEIIFDADGTQEGFSASANQAEGRFETIITPSGRPAGTYRIIAQQRDANQTLSLASFDAFIVPCDTTTPTLTISPPATSPGFVVQVMGTGFPAGSTVNLSWSLGIGAGRPIEVVVGDDGRFVRQVLLFAHDFTGLREMTAGTPANPQAFDEARASLLVAPGQGSPPGYSIFDAGPTDRNPIVIRR